MVGGRKKNPSPNEISEAEAEGEIEARESDGYGRGVDGVAFDYQVIEDENILKIFKANPWLSPVRPNFSRLCFLTNMTAKQASLLISSLERKLKRLKYSRKSRNDKMLCESLFDHYCTRINDSIGPHSKLDILATNRRILQLERLKQKRGFLRR